MGEKGAYPSAPARRCPATSKMGPGHLVLMGPAASANQHPWGLQKLSAFSKWATRWKRPTQERSVPLALVSLVLGSRRSETGLCEIGSGELARVRHRHETRPPRVDRGQLFCCCSNDSTGDLFGR
jgi:hypothetical protein